MRHKAMRAIVALCLAVLSLASTTAIGAPPAAPDLFQPTIDRLFLGDGCADVRVIFGYENYEGLKDPCDPARAQHFMKYLVARSFEPVEVTPDLARELGVPGEMQNLRVFQGAGDGGRKFRVSLIWSSLTSSTAKNIGSEYARQLVCSGHALKFMQKAASEAEVMIYVGHSRGGGGPDTYPPETLKGPNVAPQVVDFAYYRRTQPGLASLGSSFAKSPSTPSFIVWTGCLSHNHFFSWLNSAVGGKSHPTCLVLSTRLISHVPGAPQIGEYDEALMTAVNTMETLMHRLSQRDLEQRLQTCEIAELRDPFKPAWKVTMLPGKKLTPAPASAPVAAGE
jgi:hypothetical protein